MVGDLFAGAALGAFFNVLLDRIATKEVVDFFKQRKLNDGVLRKLKMTMNTVSGLLEDAEEKQITKPAVRNWLDDLKDVAYDADDLLDEIAYQSREKQHLEAGPKMPENWSETFSQVRNFFSSPERIGELQPELEKILGRIEELLQEKKHLNLKESDGSKSSLLSSQGRLTTSLVNESGIYGRVGDKEAIVNLLLSDDAGSTCPAVVSVVGMGGIGKTTLAQLVFNDSQVKGRFDKLKVWVCVSEEVDVFKLTKNILKEIDSSDCDKMTPNRLQLELQEKVKGERVLLVMDDVWNNIDWELLLKPLQSVAPGSKVLVTTREERVLSEVKGVSIYQLEVLSEEDSWSLFANHAFDGHSSEADADLKELGTKIIRKCKGLPLAVKTIGSLLYSKRKATEWEKILESNIWDLKNNKIIPALRLSYHYLPSPLKQCFVYCAMFPKDFEFRKEDLILLWMAERFIVQDNNERRELEEIGEEYFEDLCSRSFFQKYNEDEDYFVMHDLLNDLAKSIAGEFCYNNVEANSGKLTKKTRHVFYKGGDDSNTLEELEKISKAQCLRTFICSMEEAEYRHVVNLLPGFGRLRVLHFSGDSFSEEEYGIDISHLDSCVKHLRYLKLEGLPILNIPETMPYLQRLIIEECENLTSLPDSIGDMKDLRHLNLQWTGIKLLPDSIGNLKDLRHLSIKQCQNLTSLPDSIGDMKDLRQLCLQETGIKLLPDSIGNLKGLRHLSIKECQNLTSLPDSIGDMKDLRHLSIKECENLTSLPDSIGDIKDLRHLCLVETGIKSLPDSIGNLKDLRHLSIKECQNLTSLPDSIGDIKDLRHLCLQKTGIKSLLDSIGNLKDLRHLDLGFTHIERLPESVCDLHSLQHLSLDGCFALVELPVKMSDLVNLCHLDIRYTELRSMPPQMGKLIKLQTLSNFIVGTDEGYTIAELGQFRNLQGELEVRDLQNMRDEQDGLKAKMKDKSRLEELKYVWEEDGNNTGAVDKSLLQHLEPHVNIKRIIIEGYRGIDFPKWIGDSSFSNIVNLSLYNCKYCTRLPPLGQLASLRDLFMMGFDSLVSVGAEFYGSSNSIQPFRSLERLHFDSMSKLQQWSSYENETEEDDFTAFPLLAHLTISYCPELEMAMRQEIFPSTLKMLTIAGCNKITSGHQHRDLHKFFSLSSFSIASDEDIESFPGMLLLPSTLIDITISNLQNLKSLDYAGLHHLISLESLSMLNCPKLECIPDEGLPESLTYLYIHECPLLEERCRKEQGEDWPKIARIQEIVIDHKNIESTEEEF